MKDSEFREKLASPRTIGQAMPSFAETRRRVNRASAGSTSTQRRADLAVLLQEQVSETGEEYETTAAGAFVAMPPEFAPRALRRGPGKNPMDPLVRQRGTAGYCIVHLAAPRLRLRLCFGIRPGRAFLIHDSLRCDQEAHASW